MFLTKIQKGQDVFNKKEKKKKKKKASGSHYQIECTRLVTSRKSLKTL
jgi:hypothetical protein